MRTAKNALKRQDKIRDLLISKGNVILVDLCSLFNCSEATIRNDLAKLEEQGILKRIYGGAMATDHTSRNANITNRINLQQSEKDAIAEYVVTKIIKPNMIITLDSGTTNMVVAQKILDYKISCTIITNSFLVAGIVSKSSNVELHLAGGCYDPDHGSFHDEVSDLILKTMRSEICFISANGIDNTGNVTNSGIAENAIKQQMIKQALQTIILADHSKIDKVELKVICQATDVNLVITDDKVTDKQLKMLTTAGFKVVIA